MRLVRTCTILLLLVVFTVGRAFAQSDSSLPLGTEDLTTVDLIINSNQVVGQPLRGEARIRLFDENDNPVTSYSLVDSPLVLIPSSGVLYPDTVDDQALFNNGSINLLPLGVTYTGPSASINITAWAGTISSNTTVISFNGYDIISASFTDGSPITQIFEGVPTSISVPVRNNGPLLPAEDPWVRTYFKSGGGSVKVFFDGRNNGQIDTVNVLLPDVIGSPREDTLLVELMAGYNLDTTILYTADTLLIPVTILPTPLLTIVSGSVTPDSIYTGQDLTLGFDVMAESVVTDIDSTPVTIRLVRDPAGTIVTTLFTGTPTYTQPQPDILQYRNIIIPGSAVAIDSGMYRVEFDYAVYSGAPPTIIRNVVADSMLLKRAPVLTTVDSTLAPIDVIGGATVPFSFDVRLEGSVPVDLVGSRTTFSVAGGEFSTTVSLRADGQLEPGLNKLTADPIQIPLELAPGTLTAEAVIAYRETGIGNSIRLETTFGGREISVLTPITIQLVSTDITGVPNAPYVNTGQEFQITGRVANPSERAATNVTVTLRTNGQSTLIDSVANLAQIPAGDTADVVFRVRAADQSDLAEVLNLTAVATGAEVLDPIDDEAVVTVQRPANLSLSCEFVGVTDDYVGVGERFALIATLANNGQAHVDSTGYEMTSFGLNLGLEDPRTGTIVADSSISFILTAPDFDTLATVAFRLDNVPIERNTGQPASIDAAACTLQVVVSSMQPDLVIEGEFKPGNLVPRGIDAEVFTLYLTNRGLSARSPIKINQIGMSFADRTGAPLSVRSILETATTGFYDSGILVTTATAGSDRLLLNFDNYIIEEGVQRYLVFKARVRTDAPEDFRIRMTKQDIVSEYTSGPFAGQPTGVSTPTGDSTIVADGVTAVTAGAQSLTIRDNPFNPLLEPAEFSYDLAEPGGIEFRILTLTGEAVYSKILRPGEAGTDIGTHVIEWDGRNGEGKLVLNGVYVAILETRSDGGRKLLKVAVVK
ncbi:hypothetical protein KQH51_01535 [bacterium]|nr:hypothetical protein [bacterium]MCB2201606.1 hypothetical protein [bacterium]